LFDAAQAIIQNRTRRVSDSEMLERLKTLYQYRGFLWGLIIDEAEGLALRFTRRSNSAARIAAAR